MTGAAALLLGGLLPATVAGPAQAADVVVQLAGRLQVGNDVYPATPLTNSAQTPAGGITGVLRAVPQDATPGCEPADFAGQDFTGAVAVVRQGGCGVDQQQLNAAAAGAIGLVVARNAPGDAPLAPVSAQLPAGVVSQADGDAVFARAGSAGTLELRYAIDREPPSVTITGVQDGASYVRGSVPVARCTADDDVQLDDDGCTLTGYSNAAGTHVVTATATDRAGRTTTVSLTYTVTPAAPVGSVRVAGSVFPATPFEGSPGTPAGGLTGPLAVVPQDVTTGCEAGDFAGQDWVGKIALIARGGCTFETKQSNAAAAGAIGVVIVNNTSDLPTTPTIGDAGRVPTGIVTQADGATLATRAGFAATLDLRFVPDASPPVLSITGGPADGATYVQGSVPAAPACTATDDVGLDARGCVVTGYSTALGTHTLTFTATDLAGRVSTQTRTYTVTATSPATITGTPPATVVAGQPFSFAYTVGGVPAPAVTLASGALPAGVSLSPAGVLSGTPTVAGASTFAVRATNPAGAGTTPSQTITVLPGAPADLAIEGGNAQAATAGQPFAQPLAVRVTDAFGNPVPGQAVSFGVAGGSASFGGAATATATTSAAGVATAGPLTAGRTAGPVTVTAALPWNTTVPVATFTGVVLAVTSARADLRTGVTLPASAARGSSFTATVTVTNAGPNAASTLVAGIDLGPGLTITSAPGASVARGSGSAIWTAPGLASGRSLTYTVTVRSASRAKPYTSGLLAAALSVVPDPSLRNNAAVAQVRLT